MKYRILYLGDSRIGTNSLYRANALSRLGHEVTHLDPWLKMYSGRDNVWCDRVHYSTGYLFVQWIMRARLKRELEKLGRSYDAAWVTSGELFGPGIVRDLKAAGTRTVLFNMDDPTGSRDGARWLSLRAAITEYDLCALVREESVKEFSERGAHRVMRVCSGYDELEHRPFLNVADIHPDLRSKVAFVGTWMEDRDDFMAKLIERKVPVSIWGNRWQKSPRWNKIKSAWRGPALAGRDYAGAIQGAKICLGLLSRGNRDRKTTRSAEIPYAGGLLCAERTSEHLAMYREGYEAVFWSDADECARLCHELLADAPRREAIRQAGRRRVLELKIGNEDCCRRILRELFMPPMPR